MPKYQITAPDGKSYVVTAPDGATQEQVLAYAQENYKPKETAPEKPSDIRQAVREGVGNIGAGLLRGAGSIGSTLLRVFPNSAGIPDESAPPPPGIKGAGYERAMNYAAKRDTAAESADRRAGMDEGLSSLGADPASWLYKGGKLGGEIAGTAGTGAGLAVALRAVPAIAKAAPAALESIGSGGMSVGGLTGARALATRIAGGAAGGGAAAGLVNPEDAGAGALVGGALPPVVQGAGKVGQMIGQANAKKLAERLNDYGTRSQRNQTIENSLKAGYVIPPNMVEPTFMNQLVESISGKQATQQLASTKNNKITEGLVRKSLGLPDDAAISSGALEDLRKTAGRAYAEVSGLSPQAAADLEALKVARNEAQGWFKAYNRSARPDDLAKAKEARALSEQLETSLETHAADAGRPELVPSLRDARKQIAKTYTVGRALNDASGTVDARVLGRMHEKGLPLSDGLDTAGRFASAFPTVAKSPQQIGSPAAHNLKSIASMLMAGGGYASMGPAGAAMAAVPFAAPPIARALMFRQGAQKGLIEQAPEMSKAAQLAQLLNNPELQQYLLRAAPVTASQAQ